MIHLPKPPETGRLIFRQHINADLEPYCAMEMDTAIRQFVGGYPRTREDAEKRFAGTIKPITNGLGIWAIVQKETGAYIGRGGIYPHLDGHGEPVKDEASLSLYVAKDQWRQGFATEAGKAFIDFGFDVLKLDRIVAMVQAGNEASVKVLQKLGLHQIGTEVGQQRTFYHFLLERG